ncbi:MAG TPA: hypothetical protein VFV33_05470, partial [Gemmatimonadaceae bacterium]|nr:hypothetical protein [Gemmatimonadaceae bacterium]
MRSRLLRLLSLFALLALLTPPLAPALHAQRAQRSAIAPVDSSARRCLDVGWLHASASCEGRVLNASALALMGGSGGALAGLVGGVVAPTRCLGHAEKNAVRGAI